MQSWGQCVQGIGFGMQELGKGMSDGGSERVNVGMCVWWSGDESAVMSGGDGWRGGGKGVLICRGGSLWRAEGRLFSGEPKICG